MQQKDLLVYLNNFIQRKETTDSADILEKRAFKPEVPILDKNTEDAITALYNNLKKYNIPSEILFSLHQLAERLDPEDNSIIDVLYDPNPANINALIAAAQKVEHYEIASYGTLATLAEQLGYKKAVKLLAETLEEEKETDLKLTDLAVGNINQKAQK